ncbi:MAG: MFS transporter [Muribaculaceae bacterium]|nr:MFS transporter [Muribaculaceae bacterium]
MQFFCWFAFLFLWTYATNTVAHNAFDTPTAITYPGIEYQGHTYEGKYLIANDSVIILDHGKQVSDFLSTHSGEFNLTIADIVNKHPNGSLEINATEQAKIANASECKFISRTVLDATSHQYNEAGNWVGVLYAIQALGSVLWAVMLPKFRSRKFSYTLSLLLGAVGFFMTAFVTNQYLLFVAFVLIGCAWAAMLAWPFTILTNSLRGGNIGAYLGLFNCTICVPQIVAALVGGWILTMLSVPGELAPEYLMMAVAAVALVIGSVCVFFIKEGPGKEPVKETPAISENI